MTNMLEITARERRFAHARRSGFAEGVASVFCVRGKQHPAPPSVRRGLGSLLEDFYALQRDGERLVSSTTLSGADSRLAILAIFGVLTVAIVAIALDRPTVGVAGLLTGGAAAIWAMRRRSAGPDGAASVDLDDGDAVEAPALMR